MGRTGNVMSEKVFYNDKASSSSREKEGDKDNLKINIKKDENIN